MPVLPATSREATVLVTKSFNRTAVQAHEREAAGLPVAVMSLLNLAKSTHSRKVYSFSESLLILAKSTHYGIGYAIGKAQKPPTLIHSDWDTDSGLPSGLSGSRAESGPSRQGQRLSSVLSGA